MTDEQLVRAALAGDKTAENSLLNKYSPLCEVVSSRFFLYGGEAEDLAQEGRMGLYSAIRTYEERRGASFFTYAYNCIRNGVIDAVKRSAGAKRSALNNFVPILEIYAEPSADDPEDEVIRRENRREFNQKISRRLSSFEFKITVMRLDGMSVSEIATVLSKSPKSVSNALGRAKAKLYELYSSEK